MSQPTPQQFLTSLGATPAGVTNLVAAKVDTPVAVLSQTARDFVKNYSTDFTGTTAADQQNTARNGYYLVVSDAVHDIETLNATTDFTNFDFNDPTQTATLKWGTWANNEALVTPWLNIWQGYLQLGASAEGARRMLAAGLVSPAAVVDEGLSKFGALYDNISLSQTPLPAPSAQAKATFDKIDIRYRIEKFIAQNPLTLQKYRALKFDDPSLVWGTLDQKTLTPLLVSWQYLLSLDASQEGAVIMVSAGVAAADKIAALSQSDFVADYGRDFNGADLQARQATAATAYQNAQAGWQYLQALAVSPQGASTLASAGIDSAYKIISLNQDDFVADYGSLFNGATPEEQQTAATAAYQNAVVENEAHLDTFFAQNADLALATAKLYNADGSVDTTAVDKLDWTGLEGYQDDLLPQLRMLKQVLGVVAGNVPTAKKLIANGELSALHIAKIPQREFVERYVASFGGDPQLAAAAYARAQNVRTRTVLNYAAINDAFGAHYNAAEFSNLTGATHANLNGLPDYDELFGTLDYCSVSPGRAIDSPAAYFVELMRLRQELVEVELPLAAGLLAYYPFDGNADNDFIDFRGRVEGGAVLTPGRPTMSGSAYEFNGAGQYIDLDSLIALRGDFTVAAWVYLPDPADGAYKPIISKQTKDGELNVNAEFNLQVDINGELNFFMGNGDASTNSGYGVSFSATDASNNTLILTKETWYHVAVTVIGTTATLYYNGAQAGQATFQGNRQYGALPVQIGRYSNDLIAQYWIGNIQGVCVYQSGLTAAEITTLYNATGATGAAALPADPTKGLYPLAYYPFAGNADNVIANFNGQVEGGAALTTGRTGQTDNAYDFSGSSQYINLDGLTALPDDFTVAAWIYLPNPADGKFKPIISKQTKDGQPNTNAEFDLQVDKNGGLDFFMGNGDTKTNSGYGVSFSAIDANSKKAIILSADTWYHVAVTVAGATATIYVNGAPSGQSAFQGNRQSGALPVQVGRYANSTTPQYWDGKLQDVWVYQRALTPGEVEALNFAPPVSPLTAANKAWELSTRRPDLTEIPLDDAHTFDAVPYPVLVNKVLAAKIAADEQIAPAEVYDKLSAARYPFSLPFNLPYKEVAYYLGEEKLSFAQYYKTFDPGSGTPLDQALAYLQIPRAEYDDVSTAITASNAADLDKFYGTDIGGFYRVSAFLQQTALTRTQLEQLVGQNLSKQEIDAGVGHRLFINSLLAVDAFLGIENEILWNMTSHNGGTLLYEALGVANLDPINRFLRLSSRLGWAYAELDTALVSSCGSLIDDQALVNLAAIKKLQTAYDQPVDVLCSFWSPLQVTGMGDQAQPQDLFDRVFNNPLAVTGRKPYRPQNDITPLFTDPVATWDLNKPNADPNWTSWLTAGLAVSEVDLKRITGRLFPGQTQIKLNLDNLSALYRSAKIPQVMGLSVADFFDLLQALNLDLAQLASIAEVTRLSDLVQWTQKVGIKAAQLRYLIDGTPPALSENHTSSDAIVHFVDQLDKQTRALLVTPALLQRHVGYTPQQAQQVYDQLTGAGILSAHGIILAPVATNLSGGLGAAAATESLASLWDHQSQVQRQTFAAALAQFLGTSPQIAALVAGQLDRHPVLPSEGLEAAYPLADGSAANTAGAQYQGTLNGGLSATVGVGGRPDTALVFNGTNGYIELAGLTRLGTPRDMEYTLAAWIFLSDPADGQIKPVFGKQTRAVPAATDASAELALQVTGTGVLTFFIGNGDPSNNNGYHVKLETGDPLQAERWYHVAVTVNGHTHRSALYVDGQQVASGAPNAGTARIGSQALTIGQDHTDADHYFKGAMQDARVYDNALAADQVQQLGARSLLQSLLVPVLTGGPLKSGDPAPQALLAPLNAATRYAQLATTPGLSLPQARLLFDHPAYFDIDSLAALSVEGVQQIYQFKQLDARFGSADGGLVGFFAHPPAAGGKGPNRSQRLAAISGWSPADIEQVIAYLGTGLDDDVAAIGRIADCIGFAQTSGVDIADLTYAWGQLFPASGAPTFATYGTAAAVFLHGLKSRSTDAQWQKRYQAGEQKFEPMKRDALVGYTIYELQKSGLTQIRTPRDLFGYLLIDVEMGFSDQTSPIKEANTALQLYFYRCRQQLEPGLAFGPQLEQWWPWMKNYRVWQANREVFLYPENYLVPGTSKTQTPPMAEFKKALLQNDIDEQTVAKEVNTYLDEFTAVSRLRIVGSHLHDRVAAEGGPGPEKQLYLIGRSDKQPYDFYYRSLDLHYDPAAQSYQPLAWAPWEKIGLTIKSDYISPVYAFNRLFIFWVEARKTQSTSLDTSKGKTTVSSATVENNSGYEVDIYFSFYNFNKEWAPAQKLDPPSGGWLTVFGNLNTPPQKVHPFVLDQTNLQGSPGPLFETSQTNIALFYVDEDSVTTKGYFFWDILKETSTITAKKVSIAIIDDALRTAVDTSSSLQVTSTLSSVFGSKTTTAGSKAANPQSPDLSPPAALKNDASFKPFQPNTSYQPFQPVTNQPGWFIATTPTDQFLLIPQKAKGANPNEASATAWPTISGSQFSYSAGKSLTIDYASPTPETFNVVRLGTNVAAELSATLFAGGVDALLSLDSQSAAEHPFPAPGSTPPVVDSLPSNTLDFDGAAGQYFREIFFHIPFLVGYTLNSRQKNDKGFAAAQHWYQHIFNPTIADTGAAIKQTGNPNDRYWRYLPFRSAALPTLQQQLTSGPQIAAYENDPGDPQAIAHLRPVAYQKAVVMEYIDNLIDWGDWAFSHNTLEYNAEAVLLYIEAYNLLGPAPRDLGPCRLPAPLTYAQLKKAEAQTSATDQFLIELSTTVAEVSYPATDTLNNYVANSYFGIPQNEKFAQKWATIKDRLFKIHHGLNIEGVFDPPPLFEPPIDPGQLVQALADGGSLDQLAQGQGVVSPYRFSVVLEKAKSAAATTAQLGAALLAALEKQDAEALALLRATQEQAVLQMTTDIKSDQIQAAGDLITGLNASLASAQARQKYYAGMLSQGLNVFEQSQIASMQLAAVFSTTSNIIQTAAGIGYAVPQVGSPFAMTYGGQQLGSVLSAVSGGLSALASLQDFSASMSGLLGGYQRRAEEWTLQQTLAADDVTQIKSQIQGAQAQQSIARQDLAILNKTIDQNQALQQFLTSKFTNKELYQWMAGTLSALHFQAYQTANQLALAAQNAYQFETTSGTTFIHGGGWQAAHKGLLSGETLSAQLAQMEKAYLQTNERRFEINKTISLMQYDPKALLELRAKGTCQFKFDEKLFAYDFPGHYARQIKSIALSFPALVGPYQNIHATLTQMSNKTLVKADASAVDYLLGGQGGPPAADVLRQDWRAHQQIALSQGLDDSGLFQLNFADERYLPFEGTGALSQWQLDLPKATNRFDFDSLTDVVITLNYTALQGGPDLQQAVAKNLTDYNGARLFGLAQEFSGAWYQFLHPQSGATEQVMKFTVGKDMFPLNLSGYKITALYLQLDSAPGANTSGNLPTVSLDISGTTEAFALGATNNIVSASKDKLDISDFRDQEWTLSVTKGAATDPLRDKDGYLDPAQVQNMGLIVSFAGALDW